MHKNPSLQRPKLTFCFIGPTSPLVCRGTQFEKHCYIGEENESDWLKKTANQE